MFKQAIRFLYRDWRAGELGLLALALIVSVASITTVSFFTNRVDLAIKQQSNELLAGDFVISSSDEINPKRISQAEHLALTTTKLQLFRSVVVAGDKVQMVEIKVTQDKYPLRGELLIADRQFAQEYAIKGKPASGEVWVEPRLLQAMKLDIGDVITIGATNFKISKIIAYEPDRGGDFFRMAPRVIMAEDDLAGTYLIQPGSRVNYRLLIAGEREQIAQYSQLLDKTQQPGEEFISLQTGRPEIRFAFERADFFLNIVALISVLLGSIATAMAAQRYTKRHIDTVAILRTTGVTQAQIFRLFLLEMLIFAIVVSLIGCVIGYLAQYALTDIMSSLILSDLPSPDFSPVVIGGVTGLIALLGFVMPPIWLLKQTPPIRVLRRNEKVSLFSKSFVVIFVGAIFVLWVWRLGQGNVAQYILLGAIGTIAALYLNARLIVYLLQPLRNLMGVSWRYGLANLSRRTDLSSLQITAFGLGIMFIILNSLIRTELMGSWRNSMPVDTPNYFFTNVQSEQIPYIQKFFTERNLPEPVFAPMTRGRLIEINGRQVNVADYQDPRAKNLILRDFNLSWSKDLPDGNKIIKGRWWREDEAGKPYLSLDPSIAEALQVKVGDQLKFDVAGTVLDLQLLNTRGVDWNSFRVNFFSILPHGLLDEFPTNWVSSIHVESQDASVFVDLVRTFPNITIIDVDVIISRIRTLMDRIATAVEYLLGFTLIIGIIIMLTAMQATQDERRHEAALLHTLGASRKWILRSTLAEFALLGLVAGGIAGIAATVTGHILAKQVFKFPFTLTVTPTLTGMLAGVVVISLIGYIGTHKVLRQPPVDTFRRT